MIGTIISDILLQKNILSTKHVSFKDLPESADARYKIWIDVFVPFPVVSKDAVTLVSQCSVEQMHHIQDLTSYWKGPVSVGSAVSLQ